MGLLEEMFSHNCLISTCSFCWKMEASVVLGEEAEGVETCWLPGESTCGLETESCCCLRCLLREDCLVSTVVLVFSDIFFCWLILANGCRDRW